MYEEKVNLIGMGVRAKPRPISSYVGYIRVRERFELIVFALALNQSMLENMFNTFLLRKLLT